MTIKPRPQDADSEIWDLARRVRALEATPSAPSGIRFDTDPQVGGYLHVETTTEGPRSPYLSGIDLFSDDGITIENNSNDTVTGEGVQILNHGFADTLIESDWQIQMRTTGINVTGGIIIDSAEGINLDADSTISIASDEQIVITSLYSGFPTGMFINANGSGLKLQGAFGVVIEAPSGNLEINNVGGMTTTPGGGIYINADDRVDITLGIEATASGKFFRINDGYAGGSTPVLLVDVSTTGAPTYHIKSGATWVADLP